MRKAFLTAMAGAVLAAALGASPGAAQQAQPRKAFVHYIDMWVMRAGMLRVCNQSATAQKVESVAARFMNKGLAWDMARAQRQTTRMVTRYVSLFNGWLTSTDATRQASAKQLFSADACKNINMMSRFEVGFLRGRLRKMQ